VTAKWLVPEGDTIAEHHCDRCSEPWALCVCETECGAARFADCPLPLGHGGFCVERSA
jgi:hypothetical protein